MRVVAATLGALALASAGAGAAAGSDRPSGLRGVVMRGPTTPVCIEGRPCEEPAAGIVLEFSRAGRVVSRIRTGAAGRYLVKLRSGTYGVTTSRRRVGTNLIPRQVRVPKGRFGRVDFYLDTGIQ